MFDIANFREVKYEEGQRLFFDKSNSFHDHFGHKRKTTKFPYHKNILQFLSENPEINIFFTLDEGSKPFKKVDSGFLINMLSYGEFCKTIGTKTGGRSKAFLGQNLKLEDISFSKTDRDEFIIANASEQNIIEAIRTLPEDAKLKIKKSLDQIDGDIDDNGKINQTEFINAFSRFLTDSSVQGAFYAQLPRIQIEILKSHVQFLEVNLDKDETYIQNWIDEDEGKYRKQRCLIFGIEYVDPKREGEFMRKRFDILAEQNLDNHILIELKSPCSEVFSVKTNTTGNNGVLTEYHLSHDLGRAIPQILGYKKWYENARPEEIQAIGIEKKQVSKCIIVIGTRKQDDVWKENFQSLKSSLAIELLTYSDLIDRLKNTIKNLENSL